MLEMVLTREHLDSFNNAMHVELKILNGYIGCVERVENEPHNAMPYDHEVHNAMMQTGHDLQGLYTRQETVLNMITSMECFLGNKPLPEDFPKEGTIWIKEAFEPFSEH